MDERAKAWLIEKGITAFCGLLLAQTFGQALALSGLINDPAATKIVRFTFFILCEIAILIPASMLGAVIAVDAMIAIAIPSAVVALIEEYAIYETKGVLLSTDLHYTMMCIVFATPTMLILAFIRRIVGKTKRDNDLASLMRNPWFGLIAFVCTVLSLALSVPWKDIRQSIMGW